MNAFLSCNSPSYLPFFSGVMVYPLLLQLFSNLLTTEFNFCAPNAPPPYTKPTNHALSIPSLPLFAFIPDFEDEVRDAIMSSYDSSCYLDTIPTSLLKSCLDVVI